MQRQRHHIFSRLLVFVIFCAVSSPAFSQDVLTYHNNNNRTGTNPAETTLTLANVNAATFGKLFVAPVDDLVDAQPLIVNGVSIGGTVHNILITVTEHGSVYAFDSDSGTNLWQVSTLQPSETTADDRGCDQVPAVGVTDTPVIFRPKTGNPVIYLVAMSKDSNGAFHQRLHALDLTTGNELHNGPVEISGSYPGTGDNSSNGNVIFDPGQYKERAGLLLVKHTVYLAWASHCDIRPYTGWIMGYDINTLQQVTVINVTPNGNEGGMWSSGGGMTADATTGDIFVPDGNGVFDTTLNAAGFPSQGDFGNALLRITTGNGLAVADYFEMKNGIEENGQDIDLGSGGAVLANVTDPSGTVHKLAIAAGKDTNIYLVDRTNMGKYSSTSNHIYQELDDVLPGGMWATPALFNGRLYYGPVGSPIYAFQFSKAKLLLAAVAHTPTTFAYPGASPSISSNAGQNTIVWAVENKSPAVLHAYDARTLNEIYNTNQAANNRDHFGPGNKFVTPTIANGKVYVGTQTGVGVFGLLK